MRVCQFRHFGTRHESGIRRLTGSNLSLANAADRVNIKQLLRNPNHRPEESGVFIPLRNISTDFAMRLARVSWRLASVTHRTYSLLWV